MPTRCFKPNSMATQQHGGRGLSPRPCDRCAAGRGRPAAAANPPLRPADEPCPTPTPTGTSMPHLTFAHDLEASTHAAMLPPGSSRFLRSLDCAAGYDGTVLRPRHPVVSSPASPSQPTPKSNPSPSPRPDHQDPDPTHNCLRWREQPAFLHNPVQLARSTPGTAGAPSAARPLRTRTTWRSPSETRSPFLPPQSAILLVPPSPALPPWHGKCAPGRR